MPVYRLSVPGCSPQAKDQHDEAEQADGSVSSSIVGIFFADERPDQDDRDSDCGSSWQTILLRDGIVDTDARLLPSPANWPHDVRGRDVQSDHPDGECEPKQERDNPILVVVMKTKTSGPPASGNQPERKVEVYAILSIKVLSFAEFLALLHASRGRNLRGIALLNIQHSVVFLLLVQLLVDMNVVVVLRARIRNYAGFGGSASSVDRNIATIVGSAGAVMEMSMSVLMCLVERWIVMIMLHDLPRKERVFETH